MAKEYEDDVKGRAATLFIKGGQSLRQISLMDDMPSLPTLSKWNQLGEGNSGRAWQESRTDFERDMALMKSTQRMERSVDAVGNVVERAKHDVLSAIATFNEQLAEQGGFKSASYSQLKDLYQFLLDLENRDALGQMLELMKDFVTQVAKSVAFHVSDPAERAQVRSQMQTILEDYQKRLEPLVKMSKSRKI